MNELLSANPDVRWENIAHISTTRWVELSEPDRDAVLPPLFQKPRSPHHRRNPRHQRRLPRQKRVSRAGGLALTIFHAAALTGTTSAFTIVVINF